MFPSNKHIHTHTHSEKVSVLSSVGMKKNRIYIWYLEPEKITQRQPCGLCDAHGKRTA